MWTNYAYKAPLACSALACILGNLFYCLSFDLKSLPLLLLARLVTGVGALSSALACEGFIEPAGTENSRLLALVTA